MMCPRPSKGEQMAKPKNWFIMKKKEDDTAEIEIFDEIDSFWGMGAKQFKEKFDEIKDASSIRLLLNSPGGSVFDGMSIYNILSSVRNKLTVEVVGLAASIASVIALAGDKLIMAEGSYLMIHNPWTMMAGGSEELRKAADILDKMKKDYSKIYAEKTGMETGEIEKLMADETWMTADEAVENGFADETTDYGQIAARFAFDKYNFAHLPQMLADIGAKKGIDNITEFERFLRNSAGFSRSEACIIASHGYRALTRGEPDSAQSATLAPCETETVTPVINYALQMRERELDFELRRVTI